MHLSSLWAHSAENHVHCRLSWYPLTYRGHLPSSRHLTEQALQVFACFAPFWPLHHLRLSQVNFRQLNDVCFRPCASQRAKVGAELVPNMCDDCRWTSCTQIYSHCS